jgi:2,5-furandicarboxylate decarboxylase 1
MTAYWQEFTKRGLTPVLLFEHVKESSIPVVSNIFANRKRIERIIGVPRGAELYDVWANKTSRPIEPEIANNGQVKEIVATTEKNEKELDAARLPIPRYFKQDAGRYITSGIVVAKDPKTGISNLSFARLQLKGKRLFGASMHSKGNLWTYHQRAAQMKMPFLPVAVVIGCDPILYLVAGSRRNDEYRLAGGLKGEPISLVRCETSDILVPADAEIVLEGKILTQELDAEGPFSEYTGYVTGRSTRNVFILDALTRRKDAIYQSIMPSNSAEHLLLGGIGKESVVYSAVKASVPEVRGINWPVWGTHFVAIISLTRTEKTEIQRKAATKLISQDPYLKYVIVVDDDVDILNDSNVLWALSTRSQPLEDFQIIGKGSGNMLDPSQTTPGETSRVIIYATKPKTWCYETPSLPQEILQKVSDDLVSSSALQG